MSAAGDPRLGSEARVRRGTHNHVRCQLLDAVTGVTEMASMPAIRDVVKIVATGRAVQLPT